MTDDEVRLPIGEVTPGASIHGLGQGLTFESAFVLLKVRDTDDDTTQWAFRTTEAMNVEELLGALIVQTELVKRSLLEVWDVD